MADFDAIVIGSGITGGWAAKELTERGLKVLMIERGPLIEHHERFPDRTNVQLVRVDGLHELTVAVWVRGAGETLASGTSAVAAASAAIVIAASSNNLVKGIYAYIWSDRKTGLMSLSLLLALALAGLAPLVWVSRG